MYKYVKFDQHNYTTPFKSYVHFPLLLMDGQTDSRSDYNAHLQVVQSVH